MNSVNLYGRLTRDPELKTAGNGNSYCNFTVAIDRLLSKEAKADAEAKGNPTADFPNVVAWGHSAEYLCNYGRKGTKVSVTGRLQTRSYDDRDGRKVYVTEVKADQVELGDIQREKDAGTYLSSGISYTKDMISQDIAAAAEDGDLPF